MSEALHLPRDLPQLEERGGLQDQEDQRQYTTSLDSFVLRGESNRELIQKVRKRGAGIERDLFKSTNLEAACLAAKVSSRDQCESIDRRIMSYNSLVCMDFQGPTGLRYESWDDEFYLNRHCEWFSLDSL